MLVWRAAPGWTACNSVLLLVQGILPLLTLYLIKRITDTITAAATSGGADVRQSAILIAAAAGAALFGAMCASLGRLVTEMQAQTVTDYVLDLLHAKSLETDLEYYETPSYYDTLHMAQMEAPYRPPMIVNNLVQVVRGGISLTAVAGLLFAFHWGLTLILVSVALPGMVFRFRQSKDLFRWHRRRTPTERKANYYSWMMTTDAHAKENRLLGLADILRDRFVELRLVMRGEQRSLAARRAGRELLAQTASILAGFGVLLSMAARAIKGSITPGHLVMLYMAFQRGQGFMSEMTNGLVSLYENSLFISSFYTFLDVKPRVSESPSPVAAPSLRKSEIRFESVSFSYPGSDRPAIENVSFAIRPGSRVALVGENGAGKTTLVKLLCRLYDPSGGLITVGGTDLRDLRTPEWRSGIGILFQDYARYQLSARENVWLGNIALPPDDIRLHSAAAASGADEVIRSLRDGYDTQLGKWFENGEELSVGQWQKIALARCFARDADLFILDEPTSALDAQAENEVLEAFRRLAAGRTVITISHRLSTARCADLIVVLDNGRIVEQGAHDELMSSNGVYARLFNLQAHNYA